MHDWGPFTIPVDPYLPDLVWEFYASYRERQQLLNCRDHTEEFSFLTSIWVRGQEVPVTPEEINSIYWDEPIPSHPIFRNKVEDKANQFQWVANLIEKGRTQWDISKGLIHWRDLKFEARMWTVQANSVITLATKIDKEDPVMKRENYTRNMTPPSPSASIHTTTAPLHTTESHNSPPPDLLNIVQRDKMHENQLVRLAKAIPSIIQSV
ncbi:hypothetical protein HAX54_051471 [Datura stramonium]|uniref:Putative plant transposon protein domain-containing protein n=1 Tax=Datura stramonium TaxID=4076 RepID=A0ABS8WMG3_DATST|nr:hypothetical protein [Datura stramonium]